MISVSTYGLERWARPSDLSPTCDRCRVPRHRSRVFVRVAVGRSRVAQMALAPVTGDASISLGIGLEISMFFKYSLFHLRARYLCIAGAFIFLLIVFFMLRSSGTRTVLVQIRLVLCFFEGQSAWTETHQKDEDDSEDEVSSVAKLIGNDEAGSQNFT